MKSRIIEELSQGPLSSDELKLRLDDEDRVERYLKELERDGVIVLGDDWLYYLV